MVVVRNTGPSTNLPNRKVPPCPSPPPRSTTRCWTRPRRASSPTRPSTSPAPRPSTPRCAVSRRPGATASSRCPPAGRSSCSGTKVKDMVTGAVGLAEFAHVVAAKYPINVALHTDHCPKDKLDTYVRPLLAISQERVDRGANPLFQSHMWDGSATELHENLDDRRRAARPRGQGEDHPRGGDRRRRRRGGRRRQRDQREAVHDGGGLRGHRRRARRGRQGPLPARRHVRQRARRLQAGQRQAAPGDPQGRARTWPPPSSAWPPGRSRSTWSSTAARARCRRRSPRR